MMNLMLWIQDRYAENYKPCEEKLKRTSVNTRNMVIDSKTWCVFIYRFKATSIIISSGFFFFFGKCNKLILIFIWKSKDLE